MVIYSAAVGIEEGICNYVIHIYQHSGKKDKIIPFPIFLVIPVCDKANGNEVQEIMDSCLEHFLVLGSRLSVKKSSCRLCVRAFSSYQQTAVSLRRSPNRNYFRFTIEYSRKSFPADRADLKFAESRRKLLTSPEYPLSTKKISRKSRRSSLMVFTKIKYNLQYTLYKNRPQSNPYQLKIPLRGQVGLRRRHQSLLPPVKGFPSYS